MTDGPCTASNASLSCLDRYTAVRRGTFWYSVEAKGWLWSGSATVLQPWHVCPWCGGTLPTLTTAAETLLHERKWDFYAGEDGG